MSTLHDSEIADSADVKFHAGMGDDQDDIDREHVAARLRQLSGVDGVLGKTDTEIAETLRIGTNTWGNLKTQHRRGDGGNLPRQYILLRLWKNYLIPIEWVLAGDATRAATEDLRIRLNKAQDAAMAELSPKRRPPRRGPGAHIAILAVTGALFFWGCGTAGKVYARTDGHGYHAAAVQNSKFECRSEAATELDYIACMARYGYVRLSP